MSSHKGRRRSLGRGLSSLIPENALHTSSPGGPSLLRIALDRIRRNPEQPRRDPASTELESLAASIRTHGLLSPLLVREDDEGYVLIAGERRWRAAGMAGLLEVPVLVLDREFDSPEMLLLALVENLQRADLDPVEEARGFQRLVDDFGLTQEQVAERVGRDRSTVSNALRLLRLPPRVLEALAAGEIRTGHAKALLSLSSSREVLRLLERIRELGLSVRATERAVRLINSRPRGRGSDAEPPRPIRHATDLLTRSLGAPVQIRPRVRGGGRIIIEYGGDEQLTDLVERLRGDS